MLRRDDLDLREVGSVTVEIARQESDTINIRLRADKEVHEDVGLGSSATPVGPKRLSRSPERLGGHHTPFDADLAKEPFALDRGVEGD